MGIGIWILRKVIERTRESRMNIGRAFSQRQKNGHQRFACFCAGIGLGPETDFSRDHEWAQFPFGEIIVGGDPGVFGPGIEAVSLFSKDVLDVLDSGMASGGADETFDLGADVPGLLAEITAREP